MVKKFYVVDLKKKYDIDLKTYNLTNRLKKLFQIEKDPKNRRKSFFLAEETDVDEIMVSIKRELTLRTIQNPLERFDFLIADVPLSIQLKYSFTITTYTTFAKENMNNSNSHRLKDMSAVHTDVLKFITNNLSNDICNVSDDEIYNLLVKELPYYQRTYLSQYLKYLKTNYENDIVFTLTNSVIKKRTVKSSEDFYTEEEWIFYVNYLTDIDNHIVKAFENKTYAKYWLYFILHLSLAWRKNDILSIPSLDCLNIDKYSLDWFYENEFTMSDALYIISNTKLVAEQYYTQKTGTKLHFNIPILLTIPTAIALLIMELWRRKENGMYLFTSKCIRKSSFSNIFEHNMDKFTSLKANRTLLSLANNKADELNISEGISIASYMRSHKMNYYNTSNTTLTYLKTTYDEKELNVITKTLFDKGAFGWLFDYVVSTLDENKTILFKDYDIEALENISGYLVSEQCNKHTVINELLNYSKDELVEILKGTFISKQPYIYCSKPYCKENLNNNCMECKYSIPTVYSMYAVSDEITTLLTKLQHTECKRDKEHYLYRLLKLLSIAKSFSNAFGADCLDVFLDFDTITQQTQLLITGG